MAFQIETGSGSARAVNNHDLLTKMVNFMTSQHVATVAVNNGGTATYVVGDIMTLTHASAHLDARFEVTTVSAGVITGLRIHSSGAFALQGASAVVNAGGSGYVVGDVLEVQGGSSRCPMKFQVATLSGSAVATVTLFEGGGVYATAPGLTGAATIGVGPAAFAGNDACTLDLTMQALITPLTAVAITGGSGGGSPTVDITLAETGWTVDGRNTNNRTINSLTNEKSVVLKGDATGLTNKPFVAYVTGSATSGLDERFVILSMGLIAHNPALGLASQSFRSPGLSTETALDDGGAYIICAEDTAGGGVSTQDFWMAADDSHVKVVTQLDDAIANSDNGVYIQHYAGFMNRIGTETESPYPMYVFGSGRLPNTDPTTGSAAITGMAEARMAGAGCGWFWDTTTSAWLVVQNDNASGSPGTEETVMLPIGIPFITFAAGVDRVVTDGIIPVTSTFFKLDRVSATLILRKIPGTVDEFFLWPLTIMRRPSATINPVTDMLFGQPRDVFWISSDDGTGARIVDFSEDFVTVGGDRYLVFHNHVHTQPYQYIAIKWDV